MSFESAVYRLADHPGAEIFKDPKEGWIVGRHMRNFVNYNFEIEKLPEWMQEFLKNCKGGYRTRGELMTELEKARGRYTQRRSELCDLLD